MSYSKKPTDLPKALVTELEKLNVEPRYIEDRWRFFYEGRQLKAHYDTEAAEDLKRFHGLDAAVELTVCVLDVIKLEINTARIGFEAALKKQGAQ